MTGARIKWEGDYIKQAFADEIELASVHPEFFRRRFAAPSFLDLLADLQPLAPRVAFDSRTVRTTITMAPPRWRRSWTGAGALVGLFGLSIHQDLEEGTVSVGNGNRRRNATESFADHPSNDAAIWAAIVRAAINVCIEARDST